MVKKKFPGQIGKLWKKRSKIMDNKIKLITDSFGKEKFKFNEQISDHTILKVGGLAKLFFVATTPREIIRIVTEARKLKLPFLIIGTGSKIMISDNGFDGLIIRNRTKNVAVVGVRGKVSKSGVGVDEALVEVDSGVGIGMLVEFLMKQGLFSADISNLPGSIGGNLFISRYLQSKVKNIKVINQETEIEEIEVDDLSLKKHIIVSVVFKFNAKEVSEVK